MSEDLDGKSIEQLMLSGLAEFSANVEASEVETRCVPVELSSTALKADKWTKRQGLELSGLEWNKEFKCSPDEVTDAYTASFELDVKLAENLDSRETELRAEWYASLMKSDEFKVARGITVGDITMSEIAIESICQSWHEYKATLKEEDFQGNKSIARTIAVAGSTAKAASKMSQQVVDAQSMGMGIGLDGQGDNRMDALAAANLFKLMRDNPQLRKIMEIAGRMRQVLYAKQAAKLSRGADEVVDICLSGDIRRILPSELAKLDSPLHDVVLRNILSKQALSRKVASLTPVAKGPVVVYSDESGSMTASIDKKDPMNNRIANGKAMCLTMARLAMMQKRWCMLVGYSDSHDGNVCVLKPGEWDSQKLADWVQHFYQGGTTLDCPLGTGPFGYNINGTHIPSYWESYGIPKGKTDMILISDGLVDVSPEMKNRFNAWKQRENVRCYSIIIDCDPGPMQDVSDRLWKVKSLGVMSDAVSELCGL